MTQFSLKLLALICMLCDHLVKVVLTEGTLTPIFGVSGELWVRTMLLIVGRIAFPIFAWFCAEGCRNTKNPQKYLLRLFLFALISEVPFQLCFYAFSIKDVTLGCHNVIFTMLLGATGVFGGKYLRTTRMPKGAAAIIPAVLAMILGWVLHTDYNAWGVVLIILLYYIPEEKGRLIFLISWISVFQLVWKGWNGEVLVWLSGENVYALLMQWIGGLFSVGFLATYNGQNGRRSKWLFYWFYPAHLLILWVLRCLMTV